MSFVREPVFPFVHFQKSGKRTAVLRMAAIKSFKIVTIGDGGVGKTAMLIVAVTGGAYVYALDRPSNDGQPTSSHCARNVHFRHL